ncbi:cdc42-interacting protein 4 homolog isoform X4 [Bolinopsis microptera]|uniref:cdc42-interacting protein 4 homolog isoform X4 n=1 Tax=Bolinopsis microptera TaxID=2820187 RepID=UPI00307A2A3C
MSELNWGETLWDQWDRVQEHTEHGLEFTKKCQEFVRDRIKVEIDYAKSLRGLKKRYKLKNAEDDAGNARTSIKESVRNLSRKSNTSLDDPNFSTIKAYNVFLGQLDLIARDHEIVAEGLQEKVAERLKSVQKETTNNRKNLCNTANQLQHEYKEWQVVLERNQQKYEKAAKEADAAGQAFGRVNDDMNATKAQVEKSRSQMSYRQDLMEKSKGDYIIAVETTNNNQHEYYHQRWPGLINQMQRCEENRIEELKSILIEHCNIQSSILPHITTCIETMTESCEKISPAEDSELLMEERSNQPYPGDHMFMEWNSKAPPSAFGSHNNSTRKTKRDRKKTKIFGRNVGGSSESVNKEGLENLPPEKRKKAFKEKIKEIEGKINIQLKARGALEEILELYSQKPELGSVEAMEDSRSQMDDITQTLERLQEELYKYQCYLAALMDKTAPDKPHIGSHLQADAVSITSSVSHISHVSASHSGDAELPPPDQMSPNEFDPVSPTTNEFNSDTYYEVPDNNVPPPSAPVTGLSANNQCSVLYDYVAQHDDELDIWAGEALSIVEDNGTGWVKAKRNDNEIGLVPGNYIEYVELYS